MSQESQENVEMARRAFDAYNRRDVEAFLADQAHDVELHSAIVGGAEGTVYRGHDGIRKWIVDLDASFDEATLYSAEFRDLGDRVLVIGRIRAHGRESGVRLDSASGWVVTFRSGRIAEVHGFLD